MVNAKFMLVPTITRKSVLPYARIRFCRLLQSILYEVKSHCSGMKIKAPRRAISASLTKEFITTQKMGKTITTANANRTM